MTLADVLAVLAVLGGVAGIGSLFYVIPTRKKILAEASKTSADASLVVSESAAILLQPLQARIRELEAEVGGLRSTVRGLDDDLARERMTSQEERRVAQVTISNLKSEIRNRDQRIAALLHPPNNGLYP